MRNFRPHTIPRYHLGKCLTNQQWRLTANCLAIIYPFCTRPATQISARSKRLSLPDDVNCFHRVASRPREEPGWVEICTTEGIDIGSIVNEKAGDLEASAPLGMRRDWLRTHLDCGLRQGKVWLARNVSTSDRVVMVQWGSMITTPTLPHGKTDASLRLRPGRS